MVRAAELHDQRPVLGVERELGAVARALGEAADVDSVLEEIKAVYAEEQERLERMREADEDDDQ